MPSKHRKRSPSESSEADESPVRTKDRRKDKEKKSTKKDKHEYEDEGTSKSRKSRKDSYDEDQGTKKSAKKSKSRDRSEERKGTNKKDKKKSKSRDRSMSDGEEGTKKKQKKDDKSKSKERSPSDERSMKKKKKDKKKSKSRDRSPSETGSEKISKSKKKSKSRERLASEDSSQESTLKGKKKKSKSREGLSREEGSFGDQSARQLATAERKVDEKSMKKKKSKSRDGSLDGNDEDRDGNATKDRINTSKSNKKENEKPRESESDQEPNGYINRSFPTYNPKDQDELHGYLEEDNFVFESPKKLIVATTCSGIISMVESLVAITLAVWVMVRGLKESIFKEVEYMEYIWLSMHVVSIITTALLFYGNKKGCLDILLLWISYQFFSGIAFIIGLGAVLIMTGAFGEAASWQKFFDEDNIIPFLLFSSQFLAFILLRVFTICIVILRYRKLVWVPKKPKKDPNDIELVKPAPKTSRDRSDTGESNNSSNTEREESANSSPGPPKSHTTIAEVHVDLDRSESTLRSKKPADSDRPVSALGRRSYDRYSAKDAEGTSKSQKGGTQERNQKGQSTLDEIRQRLPPEEEESEHSNQGSTRSSKAESVESVQYVNYRQPTIPRARPTLSYLVAENQPSGPRKAIPFGGVPAVGSPEGFKNHMAFYQQRQAKMPEPEVDYF